MSKKKKNKGFAPDKEDWNDRGPTWVGYYPRLTKSKKEKEIQQERKEKERARKYTSTEW